MLRFLDWVIVVTCGYSSVSYFVEWFGGHGDKHVSLLAILFGAAVLNSIRDLMANDYADE